MKEYHKIETIFKRSETGTKKLIEGEYRNETVEMLKDIPWILTEKVDGTNIRVNWDGHKVTFNGRTERAQIPSDLVNFLTNTFLSDEAEEMFEQKFGDTEVTFYGEGYGKKIQGVGSLYRPSDVSFILFDVLIGNLWLTRDSVEDIATAFGIDVVPIVFISNLDDAVKYVKSCPRSMLNENAPMEGVVARPVNEIYDRRGNRIIVKIKAKDFEKNKEDN